jgi:hypothetical protein
LICCNNLFQSELLVVKNIAGINASSWLLLLILFYCCKYLKVSAQESNTKIERFHQFQKWAQRDTHCGLVILFFKCFVIFPAWAIMLFVHKVVSSWYIYSNLLCNLGSALGSEYYAIYWTRYCLFWFAFYLRYSINKLHEQILSQFCTIFWHSTSKGSK